jgi:hypothetical protein
MYCYIIKFPDGYYLKFKDDKRYKTKELDDAFIYASYELAEKILNYMKKHHNIMKNCIVVNKTEEIKLSKIAE